MNNTGKIKIALLSVCALVNIIMPIGAPKGQSFLFSLLVPIIFGVFATPIIVKMNSAFAPGKIENPNWNDNVFSFRKPLSFFQFGAFFFLLTGFGVIIGTALKYHKLNIVGLGSLAYGLGIFIGIKLTLLWMGDDHRSA